MRKGFTLVEMLITMLVFSITLVAIMSFFTKTAGTSLRLLNRADTYGDLFEANSILQQEISKAGPDIRYINLVKVKGETKYRGLRYSVFIPLTKTKITKQIYFYNGKIKVWEKNFQTSDFSKEKVITVNNLEPSGVNIILSTTPKEGLEFEFTSLGTRSVSYKITINKNGTKYEHKSSVFLINIR
ncbi:MAG: prepilin-type N-terminal cleavage/methylation domain-containing protein [Kosmotoga sp.]|uniref:PulJ/GspJ family protein n=1 Tax=Kosmotoga sp. TaxID=1955248 RepID=UPI0025C2CF98|nr:prepilin-type N-terminal cleavage/methylation domain-containing protein [Kosmotoga sp.]MCD6160153.1 prepilin-type N-terminal cleavage/methylation domain-containing protein [Kosmotoga sp.]